MTKDAAFPRWLRMALWGLIAVPCALQAYEVFYRGIDPDELEHLHAAYCVWRGDVPYRDFFEHHAPGLYYALQPVLLLQGARLSVLWTGRCLMWGCSLATLLLTGRLARRWGGRSSGLAAMALLAWTTAFHVKGIELRPDVPAALLLLVAVGQFTFATGGGSWRRFFRVGLLAGLALLFTQKSLVPAAGIALAACLARQVTRSATTESAGAVLARVAVPLAAGVCAVWGIASLLFVSAGAAGEFWHSTWYQLWIWPVRSSRWEHLRPTLAGDFTVWAAGGAELVWLVRHLGRRGVWKGQRGVAAIVAAVCVASLVAVKATYPQFYLLWMPLLAALAATRLVALARWLSRRAAVAGTIVAGECLVLAQFVLWRRAYWAAPEGSLPHLAETGAANAVFLLALAATMMAIVIAARARRWPAAVLLLAGLGMAYGGLRDADAALWSNRDQVAAIEKVNSRVAADERILDGFTGYGALRPHAWYYWWINEYSLALIPEPVRNEQLLKHLEESPPAAVLFDSHLALLPEPVLDWIALHYEPAEPAVLWLPRRM